VIILVRHGQTTTNASKLLVGRSDPELTELGTQQALALRPYLAGVEQVWTSPLRRARATAALAAARDRRDRERRVH
jgi:broad specificity phosphatase PhoE